MKLKYILFSFLFLLMAGTLVSCKSTSAPLPEKIEISNSNTKTVVIRDTVFKTEKDSSYYKAWLECQDGKVVMKGKPKTTPGKHLKPPNVNLKDNVLEVDCEAEAQELFAKWKDTYTLQNRSEIKTVSVLVEAKLTNWQLVQIYSGRVFLILLLLVIILSLLKYKKII